MLNMGHKYTKADKQRNVFVFLCLAIECVGHSFAYVAYFVFLGDACIRSQKAAEASKCATNLATHLSILYKKR
jgi:hypothetical protein